MRPAAGRVIRRAATVLLLTACAGPGATTGGTEPAGSGLAGRPAFTTTIEGAIAVDVSATPDGPVVAWTSHDSVSIATLDLESGQLTGTRVVSGDLAPVHHPIERPAVVLLPDGSIEAAFVSSTESGGSVYLSGDGSSPMSISGPARPETNLVHAGWDVDGSPVLTWLEDSTLSVAFADGTEFVEVEGVDDLTCDCCNPVPALSDDDLLVAYRDFEERDGAAVRNVVAIRSAAGAESFEDPVRIADGDWAIDACPFSGPDVALVDGTVVVAWMDARQSRYPDQDAASIWVDRSTDAGAAFGTDLEVASGAGHRWPTMAVDDAGVIHLFWETSGPDGGLSYAWSDDTGISFSEPVLLIGRFINDDGAPGSPTASYQNGMVVLTWADSKAGHVAAWSVGS